MLEHTKHQDHKWKFLQHALSRYVYNRSLFDIFNHNSIADIFDAILDVVSLGKSKWLRDESSIFTCPIYESSSSRYRTLGLVTTYHITCRKHTGRPEGYRFLLWKSEYTGNSTAGVPKKVQYIVLQESWNIVFYQVIKAVVFNSSPVQSLVCSALI